MSAVAATRASATDLRSTVRELHPGAWWVWALGLAAAASATTNPLLLLLVIAETGLVVALRRGDHPWSRAFRLYLWLALVVVVVRVLFRVVLGGSDGGTVLLDLPQVPLPDWVLGVRLLGPVTLQNLLAGLYDGLRLGTILVCVGAANALANPKRLLKSLPPALYEIGTAVVVAIVILPQLADGARRVRAARRLRGSTSRRGGLRRLLVPVLEDALERSLVLAAGMDARGYGRSGDLTRARRRATGALLLTGLVGLCVGVYAVLDQSAPRVLALPMLALGVVAAAAGFLSAGRRVQRSRYRPAPWAVPETLVAVCGALSAAGAIWLFPHQLPVQFPPLDRMPEVSVTALLVVLVGALPVLVVPRRGS